MHLVLHSAVLPYTSIQSRKVFKGLLIQKTVRESNERGIGKERGGPPSQNSVLYMNILPTGAEYSGIFYLRVQNILPRGAKFRVVHEYFTRGCKIFRNILPPGAKYSGKFYTRVQNIPEYFTPGFQNILPPGAKYSGKFYTRVQNIPEHFTSGCKIYYLRVQNILHPGAKYSGILVQNILLPGAKYSGKFYTRVQNILPRGAKFRVVHEILPAGAKYFTSGCKIFYTRVLNIPECFTSGCKIFYLWVQNIQQNFTPGCKIFRNILPPGVKYSGIFYLRVQIFLHPGAKYFTPGC